MPDQPWGSDALNPFAPRPPEPDAEQSPAETTADVINATQAGLELIAFLIRALGGPVAIRFIDDLRQQVASTVDSTEPEMRAAALAELLRLRPDIAAAEQTRLLLENARLREQVAELSASPAVPTVAPDTEPGDAPEDIYADEDASP